MCVEQPTEVCADPADQQAQTDAETACKTRLADFIAACKIQTTMKLEDVVGNKEAVNSLKDRILLPISYPECLKHGVELDFGYLLYGLPGPNIKNINIKQFQIKKCSCASCQKMSHSRKREDGDSCRSGFFLEGIWLCFL